MHPAGFENDIRATTLQLYNWMPAGHARTIQYSTSGEVILHYLNYSPSVIQSMHAGGLGQWQWLALHGVSVCGLTLTYTEQLQ